MLRTGRQVMANDHFISRFQTKPWEVSNRRLAFYDFVEHRFGEEPSKNLFARTDLNDGAVEKILDKFVEEPAARYRDRLRAASSDGSVIDATDWKTYRALVCLWLVQLQRLHDARRETGRSGRTLGALLREGEASLNALCQVALSDSVLVAGTISSMHRLFFTEAAYFPIPQFGKPPLLAVPLSTRHFILLAKKRDFDPEQFSAWMRTPSRLAALSIGVGSNVRRVVIPPERLGFLKARPQKFEHGLNMLRERAVSLVNVVAAIAHPLGLPAWRVTSPSSLRAAPP